jgi:hypothetical protein
VSVDPLRHLHLASEHPDPADPGGPSLDDVNAEPDDEADELPFFVESQKDAERWHECEALAEKMSGEMTDLIPAITRSLYFSEIPTDGTDGGRYVPMLEPTQGAEDAPDDVPD